MDSHRTYNLKILLLLLPSLAISQRTPFQHVLHLFIPQLHVLVIPCTQIISLIVRYNKWPTAGSYHESIHYTQCSNQISSNKVWRFDPI